MALPLRVHGVAGALGSAHPSSALPPAHPGPGNKSYAAAVTRVLDPMGQLFGDRVIAQGAERAEEMQADQAKSFMQVGELA